MIFRYNGAFYEHDEQYRLATMTNMQPPSKIELKSADDMQNMQIAGRLAAEVLEMIGRVCKARH